MSMHSFVFNRYPFPSSLYKYAVDLYDANIGKSSLINIVTNRERWQKDHIGQDVKVALTRHFFISGMMSRFTYTNARKILENYERIKEDMVVHMVAPFADPSFAAGFPNTVSIHDSPESMFKKGEYRRLSEHFTSYSWRMRMTKILYDKAMKLPYLCANSQHVANALKEYGYNGDTFVLHPPVSRTYSKIDDKNGLRKKLNLPTDRILILSVSTDEVRKNVEMVKKVGFKLKECASVVRVGSDIGSGYTFRNIDNTTMNLIYNACDLLLMPSLEEGFGYPLIEAFKTGLPVVASDIEVFHEVAGDAAIYVNPLNLQDVLRGVNDAMEYKHSITNKGERRVELYEPSVFSKKLEQFYEKLLRNS